LNEYNVARILSRLFFVIVTTLVVATLYLAKVLLLPLAIAVLFAFLLAPLVTGLERLRIPAALAAGIVITSFAAALAGAGWLIFSQLVSIANDLPAYSENISEKMSAIQSPNDSAFSRARSEINQLDDELKSLDPTAAAPNQGSNNPARKPLGSTAEHPLHVTDVSRTPGRLDELGGVVGAMTTASLSVVLTFVVLLQRKDLRNRMIRLSGDLNLRVMTEALNDAGRRISRYFSLQLLVNIVYGTVVLAVLYFIGLPHALFFGALAGICRFIPYLGWPTATIAPVILSLALFHGWARTLFIVTFFLCVEIIVFNLAEPRIYGKHVGLSSLAILIAASFWTLIWGPIGLVLSMPLTVCLVVMGRHLPSLGFLTVMLGDQPDVPLSSCFYQRLLANDELEAGEIVAKRLKDTTLEEAYDSVVIPALTMSEEDRIRRGLDESAVEFIRQTTRNLIEEFSVRDSPGSNAQESETDIAGAKVVCIPIADETDELTALMLAQVLNGEGIRSIATPLRRLNEAILSVTAVKPELVILCGLPPVAMTRLQWLFRGLRARNPEAKILVTLPNFVDDIPEAARAVSEVENVPVLTSLSQTMAEVQSLTAANQPSLRFGAREEETAMVPGSNAA
jgi:predicted PurR-regulated permease PerM